MIRDRGNIKWTAMMLPEHVKLLRELEDTHYLIEKPILDEDKISEINQTLYVAMEFNKPLEFTYFNYGKLNKVNGQVHCISELTKELRIVDRGGEVVKIKFEELIDVYEY
ncbi:MAG: YolD-like family protein [Bacillota bacterium]